MKINHYAEYLYPGTLFPETESKRLKERSANEALTVMSDRAFAFTLYDVEIRTGVLEDGQQITDRKTVNKSGRFYPGATKHTLEEIEREHGAESILAGNMRRNDYPAVVKTRRGNYQPLEANDVVLPATTQGAV